MAYTWEEKLRENLGRSWSWSAYEEFLGSLFFDESTLAPETFGASHAAYLRAAQAVAENEGLSLIGWGPSSTPYDEDRRVTMGTTVWTGHRWPPHTRRR